MATRSAIRRKGRRATITVLNSRQQPARGAEVSFAIRGVSYGSVVVGGTGYASLYTPNERATIKVSVRYGGVQQEASLSPSTGSFEFKFDSAVLFRGPPSPIARCPDGTTGQPCVDCVINGESIRICS
jgi:hypothetical protein